MYVTSRQIEILSLGTIVLEVLRAIQMTKKNTFLTNVVKKVPRIKLHLPSVIFSFKKSKKNYLELH